MVLKKEPRRVRAQLKNARWEGTKAGSKRKKQRKEERRLSTGAEKSKKKTTGKKTRCNNPRRKGG